MYLSFVAAVTAVVAVAPVCINGAEDGLARQPPMGWRSWNQYGGRINDAIMRATAQGVAAKRGADGRVLGADSAESSGVSLLDLGYNDVGLDDNWQDCNGGVGDASFHDAAGYPVVRKDTFPDMKAMTDFIHGLGLKAGWYHNNCICAEHKPLWEDDEMHYRGDANSTLDFGFDSVKLDGCGRFKDLGLYYKLLNEDGEEQAEQAGQAEQASQSSASVMIENCHWGLTVPTLDSCPYHMFRTSGDIHANWGNFYGNLQSTRKFQGETPLSRPGCWAYPDMLEVGRMKTVEEDKAHFAAWAITSSPLILGHNVTDEDTNARVWHIVANKRAIRINQDWAGHPGKVVQETGDVLAQLEGFGTQDLDSTGQYPQHKLDALGGVQVWVKPLRDNGAAVLVISSNPEGSTENVQVLLKNCDVDAKHVQTVVEVFSGDDVTRNVLDTNANALNVTVHGHAAVFLEIVQTRASLHHQEEQ